MQNVIDRQLPGRWSDRWLRLRCLFLVIGLSFLALGALRIGGKRHDGPNYYTRGLKFAEQGKLETAIECLEIATGKRTVKGATVPNILREDTGRKWKRSSEYLTDCFPNRELGILHYKRGLAIIAEGRAGDGRRHLEQARQYLELSLAQLSTLRAGDFIDLVNRDLALKNPGEGPLLASLKLGEQDILAAVLAGNEIKCRAEATLIGAAASAARVKSVSVDQRGVDTIEGVVGLEDARRRRVKIELETTRSVRRRWFFGRQRRLQATSMLVETSQYIPDHECRFATALPLKPGRNEVTLGLADLYGNRRLYKLILLVDRTAPTVAIAESLDPGRVELGIGDDNEVTEVTVELARGSTRQPLPEGAVSRRSPNEVRVTLERELLRQVDGIHLTAVDSFGNRLAQTVPRDIILQASVDRGDGVPPWPAESIALLADASGSLGVAAAAAARMPLPSHSGSAPLRSIVRLVGLRPSQLVHGIVVPGSTFELAAWCESGSGVRRITVGCEGYEDEGRDFDGEPRVFVAKSFQLLQSVSRFRVQVNDLEPYVFTVAKGDVGITLRGQLRIWVGVLAGQTGAGEAGGKPTEAGWLADEALRILSFMPRRVNCLTPQARAQLQVERQYAEAGLVDARLGLRGDLAKPMEWVLEVVTSSAPGIDHRRLYLTLTDCTGTGLVVGSFSVPLPNAEAPSERIETAIRILKQMLLEVGLKIDPDAELDNSWLTLKCSAGQPVLPGMRFLFFDSARPKPSEEPVAAKGQPYYQGLVQQIETDEDTGNHTLYIKIIPELKTNEDTSAFRKHAKFALAR